MKSLPSPIGRGAGGESKADAHKWKHDEAIDEVLEDIGRNAVNDRNIGKLAVTGDRIKAEQMCLLRGTFFPVRCRCHAIRPYAFRRGVASGKPILLLIVAGKDMVECRCPSCRHLFKTTSSDFGTETTCSSCGHRMMLDTDKLAHFEFPTEITVRLADSLGKASRISGVKIHAERGFPLAEVSTDTEGTARITRDHYKQSQMDWYSWSIMDHPGDNRSHRGPMICKSSGFSAMRYSSAAGPALTLLARPASTGRGRARWELCAIRPGSSSSRRGCGQPWC